MKKEDTTYTRIEFENFKSNVCHRLKFMGDIAFIREYLTNGAIREYYNSQAYPECFYLLAMVDYISRVNNIPYCSDFDDLRCYKLEEFIYPRDTIMKCLLSKNDDEQQKALKNAIPEFLRHNIIECEVRNVI